MKIIKKNILAVVALVTISFITGCGNSNQGGGRGTTEQSMVDEIIAANEATTELTTEMTTEITTELTTEVTTEITTEITEEVTTEELLGEPDPNVDIDMTVMTATMVFSQMNNIMMAPDSYLGQKIKVSGEYYPLYYEGTGNYYHYVLIRDALACCQNGMEFIWDEGSHAFPDEYPKEGQKMEIQGELKCYTEENYTYYYLDIDDYTILE